MISESSSRAKRAPGTFLTYEAEREAALTEPWPASQQTGHKNGAT